MLNNNICKTLILFTLLCVGMTLEAQETWKRPFMAGKVQMSISRRVFHTNYCEPYITDSTLMRNDTIINGQLYTAVNPYSGWIPTGRFAFRYDTLKRQVWIRSVPGGFQYCDNDTGEHLVYDFARQPGDTFMVGGLGCDTVPHLFTVGAVDTILLSNGKYARVQYLKAINFFANYGGDAVIEGIGSTSGPFFFLNYQTATHFKTGWAIDIDEYWSDGELIYNTNACMGLSVNEGLKVEQNAISLFPNPIRTGELLHIDFRKASLDEVPNFEIMDLQGKLLLKTRLQELNNVISISQLPASGTFIYRIYTEKDHTGGVLQIQP